MTLQFDGSNDYINFGSTNVPANTNQFTMCAWSTKTTGSRRKTCYMMSKSAGTSVDNSTWTLGVDRSGRPFGILRIGNSSTKVRGSGISENDFHHLAMTYNGSTIRLYVNGNSVASANRTGNVAIDGRRTVIGASGDLSRRRTWNGEIYDCRIYTRGLSEDEIRMIMNNDGHDFIVDGLISWCPLNDGIAGTVPTVIKDIVNGVSGSVSSSPTYRSGIFRIPR